MDIHDIIPDISANAKKNMYVDFHKVWQIQNNDKLANKLIDIKEIFRLHGFNSDFWAWRPKAFYRCYADRINHYAINYDGKVYKCTAQDYADDKVIGYLESDGNIKWNEYFMSKLFSNSTFDNLRCLKCKRLPVCMGPCIMTNYLSRKNATPLPCISDAAQYSLSSYIIEEAKKRNLI